MSGAVVKDVPGMGAIEAAVDSEASKHIWASMACIGSTSSVLPPPEAPGKPPSRS